MSTTFTRNEAKVEYYEITDMKRVPGHYSLMEAVVTLTDGRQPIVRVWFYAERDGFPAEAEYEIWNERDSRIVQDMEVLPNNGFDWNLVALAANKQHVIDEELIESENEKYQGENPFAPDNWKDEVDW